MHKVQLIVLLLSCLLYSCAGKKQSSEAAGSGILKTKPTAEEKIYGLRKEIVVLTDQVIEACSKNADDIPDIILNETVVNAIFLSDRQYEEGYKRIGQVYFPKSIDIRAVFFTQRITNDGAEIKVNFLMQDWHIPQSFLSIVYPISGNDSIVSCFDYIIPGRDFTHLVVISKNDAMANKTNDRKYFTDVFELTHGNAASDIEKLYIDDMKFKLWSKNINNAEAFKRFYPEF